MSDPGSAGTPTAQKYRAAANALNATYMRPHEQAVLPASVVIEAARLLTHAAGLQEEVDKRKLNAWLSPPQFWELKEARAQVATLERELADEKQVAEQTFVALRRQLAEAQRENAYHRQEFIATQSAAETAERQIAAIRVALTSVLDQPDYDQGSHCYQRYLRDVLALLDASPRLAPEQKEP